MSSKPEAITVILGAGASRGVSYSNEMECLSPLDRDFFDILSQQTPETDGARNAVRVTLDHCRSYEFSEGLWESLEKAFYTIHLNSVITSEIFNKHQGISDFIVENFARSIQYLLRKAHKKKICKNHVFLFRKLSGCDSILNFNYDLVSERALGFLHRAKVDFGTWIYGGSLQQPPTSRVPLLCKMHGSSNWKVEGNKFTVRQTTWNDFDEAFGYLGHSSTTENLAIVLPYWEKKIEERPWKAIWRKAAAKLSESTTLIVWGYSLPPTDIKAREFFRIAFADGMFRHLVVIDPKPEVRQKWRDMVPWKHYWQYSTFEDFKAKPPSWWGLSNRARRRR